MSNKLNGIIISESINENCKTTILTEDTESGSTKFSAVLQEANIKNRNGRIYPKDVLDGPSTGIGTEYVQERLAVQCWPNEAGHPIEKTIDRQMYIDQSNISHLINKVHWEGNLLIGTEMETANTVRGKDMQGMIKQGCKLAFSMRGVASITETRGGILYVKAPLHIIAYDWVIHPSHTKAYMQNVLSESTFNHFYDESTNLEKNKEFFLPLEEAEIIKYVKDNSKMLKKLEDQFEIGYDAKLTLAEKSNMINVKHGNDIFKIYIEDYIAKEINSIILKRF